MLHWEFSLFSFDAAFWKTVYEIIHRAKSSWSHPTYNPSILLAAIWPHYFRNAEAHALLWKEGLLTTSHSLNWRVTRLAAGTLTPITGPVALVGIKQKLDRWSRKKYMITQNSKWQKPTMDVSVVDPMLWGNSNTETCPCPLLNWKRIKWSDNKEIWGFSGRKKKTLHRMWLMWITLSTSLFRYDRWKTSINRSAVRTKA